MRRKGIPALGSGLGLGLRRVSEPCGEVYGFRVSLGLGGVYDPTRLGLRIRVGHLDLPWKAKNIGVKREVNPGNGVVASVFSFQI